MAIDQKPHQTEKAMCCKRALGVVVILMLILAAPALALDLPLGAGATEASLHIQIDTKKEKAPPNNAGQAPSSQLRTQGAGCCKVSFCTFGCDTTTCRCRKSIFPRKAQ